MYCIVSCVVLCSFCDLLYSYVMCCVALYCTDTPYRIASVLYCVCVVLCLSECCFVYVAMCVVSVICFVLLRILCCVCVVSYCIVCRVFIH